MSRTVNIALIPAGSHRVDFYPALASLGDDTLLLEKRYSVTTAVNGTGTISLPTKVSGTILWTCRLPKSGGGYTTASFYLGPGAAINLEDAIAAGTEPTSTVTDYVDSKISDPRLTAGLPSQPEVAASEKGNEAYHLTILTLTALPITVANVTGKSFGGTKIYDWPVGAISLAGGIADLTFNWQGTSIALTGSGDFALGTEAAIDSTLGGACALYGGPWAMVDPFVNGIGRVEISGGNPSANGMLYTYNGLGLGVLAPDMYLNVIIDDSDVSNGASDVIHVSGTIRIPWLNEGAFA